jgi:inosose dehydratase
MKMHRREFLLSAAAPLLAAAPMKTQAVAQAYVWTQEMKKRGLTLEQGMAEIFSSTKRAGFDQIELMSDFFTPALRDRTLAELKKSGLTAPVVYFGGNLHDNVKAAATCKSGLALAEAVRGAGTTALNHNPDPKPQKAVKEEWELSVQSEWLNYIGEQLAARDMGFLVHHHDPEMADEAAEWKYILETTDPKTVSLCVDTHWAYRGGQDPLELLRAAGSRVGSIHLRNSVNKIWSEDFSSGDLDYGPVAAWLKKTGIKPYLVVELAQENGQKITRSLEENLRRSRVYLRDTFGA